MPHADPNHGCPMPRASVRLVCGEPESVMDLFPIVAKDDKGHGDSASKRIVLAVFEPTAFAVHTGPPYETRTHPPFAGLLVVHQETRGGDR